MYFRHNIINTRNSHRYNVCHDIRWCERYFTPWLLFNLWKIFYSTIFYYFSFSFRTVFGRYAQLIPHPH
jgi:hypothetical protein